MKIKLICFGKIKDQNLKNIINDFVKRINFYYDFEIIELNEEKINNEDDKSQIKIALDKEYEKIVKYLNQNLNILLDVKSNSYTTEEFHEFIFKKNYLVNQINFFIGSSHGFSDLLKNAVKNKISFSKLTFNHQIFRLMFCEQLYRICCIEQNKKYHK